MARTRVLWAAAFPFSDTAVGSEIQGRRMRRRLADTAGRNTAARRPATQRGGAERTKPRQNCAQSVILDGRALLAKRRRKTERKGLWPFASCLILSACLSSNPWSFSAMWNFEWKSVKCRSWKAPITSRIPVSVKLDQPSSLKEKGEGLRVWGELEKEGTGPVVLVGFYQTNEFHQREAGPQVHQGPLMEKRQSHRHRNPAQSKSPNAATRVQLEHSEEWRTCAAIMKVHLVTSCCRRPMRSLKILWKSLPIKECCCVLLSVVVLLLSLLFDVLCGCSCWESWLESTNRKVLKNSQGDCARTLLSAAYSSFARAARRW